MGRKTKAQKARHQQKQQVASAPKPAVKRVKPRKTWAPDTGEKPTDPREERVKEALETIGKLGEQQRQERLRRGIPEPRISRDKQESALKRLQMLNDLLTAKPIPLLKQLDNANIRYQIEGGIVRVILADIERYDAEMQSKGTLFQQLYAKE